MGKVLSYPSLSHPRSFGVEYCSGLKRTLFDLALFEFPKSSWILAKNGFTQVDSLIGVLIESAYAPTAQPTRSVYQPNCSQWISSTEYDLHRLI